MLNDKKLEGQTVQLTEHSDLDGVGVSHRIVGGLPERAWDWAEVRFQNNGDVTKAIDVTMHPPEGYRLNPGTLGVDGYARWEVGWTEDPRTFRLEIDNLRPGEEFLCEVPVDKIEQPIR